MKLKIKNLTIALVAGILILVAVPTSVFADDPPVPANAGTSIPSNGCESSHSSSLTFFPAWYDGLLCKDGNIKSPKDMGGNNTGRNFGLWLSIIGMNLVRMLLYVVGYASLIFIIYGGFKFMTQGDNSGGITSARKTIQNAIIGLVLSIFSVAIVTFVAGRISG